MNNNHTWLFSGLVLPADIPTNQNLLTLSGATYRVVESDNVNWITADGECVLGLKDDFEFADFTSVWLFLPWVQFFYMRSTQTVSRSHGLIYVPIMIVNHYELVIILETPKAKISPYPHAWPFIFAIVP